jgi:ABC-type nickel/cobalt efflux system permease component RcnA
MRLILLIAAVIWIMSVLTTPAALLKIAADSYTEGIRRSKIIFKLLLSFLAYFFVSAFTFLLLLLIVVRPEPRRTGQEMFMSEQISFLIVVLVYVIIAWLLWSFTGGKFVKPWAVFWFKDEKPPSIFGAD